jgi:hypothetical protein
MASLLPTQAYRYGLNADIRALNRIPAHGSSLLSVRRYSLNQTTRPVVLCGCENWSLTVREEHSLRVFENGAEEDIFPEEG